MVSTPRRISSLHAATPMNPAPPITSALVNIAGHEVDVDAIRLAKPARELGGERDRAVAAATDHVIVLSVVDEPVVDAALVRVAQQLDRTLRRTQHQVALGHAVERLDAAKAGLLEGGHRVLEAIGARGADDHEIQSVSFSRAARRSGMPSLTISSTGASRIACTDPKCLRRARLRAGPMPSTESSGDVNALRERTLR